jgi:hypothetical protein
VKGFGDKADLQDDQQEQKNKSAQEFDGSETSLLPPMKRRTYLIRCVKQISAMLC